MLFYNKGAAFGRWMTSPISQFLGHISYSFYLFNVIVHTALCALIVKNGAILISPLVTGIAASVASVLFTLPLAYLSTRLVELPGIALGAALTAPTQQASVTT